MLRLVRAAFAVTLFAGIAACSASGGKTAGDSGAMAGSAMTAAAAQSAATATAPVVTDLMGDVAQVQKKLLDLAHAFPAAKYDWRPGPGVRSVREVFLHLTSDNYLMPAALGAPVDSATGLKAGDFATAGAFEKKMLAPDAVIAEMQKSFDHINAAMKAATPAKMTESVSLFGQTFTGQGVWILTTTHMHEHLGQLIAYARMNGIVPPWNAKSGSAGMP
jgi:uncharacterized damage-inducible protein DinB